MMRSHLGGGLYARGERMVDRGDRLARREVHEVEWTAFGSGERHIALDHHALRRRGVRAEAELRRDRSLVGVTAVRERRLLAVERETQLREGAVLQRATHQPGGDDRPAVVRECRGAGGGELGHLRQLVAQLAFADRRHESRRHDRLVARTLDESTEDGRRVDDRLGVRHREDRAVPPGRGRLRSRADRLLVLAAGGSKVDVRIDEGRRDHEPVRRPRLDRRDHTVGHRDAKRLVDPLRRGEHATLERQRVAAAVARDQHYATPAGSGAATGATVRTS